MRSRADLPRDLAVGTGVGAFSGAFGVGGGILLVPYLVLVRGLGQKVAQATSLVMITLAATGGAVRYALGGTVAWWPAAAIVAGGLVGVLLGSTVVQRTTDRRLQAAFGVFVVLVALRLLWPSDVDAAVAAELPSPTVTSVIGYVLAGLAMGVLSALFGVGGGIVLVPILVEFFDYGQQLANGTSLVVMIPIALLGAIRLSRPGYTQWGPGLRFGAAAVVGAVIGASIALALSGSVVRIAFAVVLLAVGVHMAWSAIRGSRDDQPRSR